MGRLTLKDPGRIVGVVAKSWRGPVLDDHAIERPGYFLYYHRGNARLEVWRAFVEFMKLGRGGEEGPP